MQAADTERQLPLVSVIIPAHNVAEYIAESVSSVLAQTFKNFEIIVVNDGSHDTPQLEKALEPFRAAVTYISQERGGVSAARNAALAVARGEFVAFLDADDVWLPDFLAEQVNFSRQGKHDLVFANVFHFGDGWSGTSSQGAETPTCEGLLSGQCAVFTSTVLAKRQAVLDAGMFNTTLVGTEDFELWVRIAKRPGVSLHCRHKVLAGYRHRPQSLTADRSTYSRNALAALRLISQRDDLSKAERAALDREIGITSRDLSLENAKQKMLLGQFSDAIALLTEVPSHARTWKISLAVAWLKLSPRSLPFLYRLLLRSRGGRGVTKVLPAAM